MNKTQDKTPLTKRLAAYSATAAAVAVTAGTATAAEVVWDIADLTSTGGLGLNFNMLTGSAAQATSAFSNTASFRLGGDPGFFDDDFAIAGPAGSAGVGFVGTPGIGSAYAYGSLLGASSSVGTGNAFAGNNSYVASFGVYAFLDTFVGTRGIVGIQFQIGGSTHYGWADITGIVSPTPGDADNTTGPLVTLHAFGYNDTAGADTHPIPEPSSLALLAMGAAGLLRRKRKDAA